MVNDTSIKGFRSFQLVLIGFLALFIAPVTMLITTMVYRYPVLGSISESATISNQVAPVLPFGLGALALFSLSYAIKHKYDMMDTILTSGMCGGFTIVAMQMCESPYIDQDRIGILGISEAASNMLHGAGAVIGFGCMILWIILCFRKSNKVKREQTRQKVNRNKLFMGLGIGMISSLSVFMFDIAGIVPEGFPTLFITEFLMLELGGIACLIKGGLILRDR